MENVGRTVVQGTVIAIDKNFTVKICNKILQIRNLTVNDQSSVRRKQSGKLMERVADIVQILEKVQVIFIYI